MSEAAVAKKNKPTNQVEKDRGVATKHPPRTREQKNAEKQALAMWALLGEGGEAYGGKLKPEIKKAEREALLKLGLIHKTKQKNGAIWLSTTDKGWDWAEQHLNEPLPEKNFGGTFVLRAWLTRLSHFLQVRGFRLSDLFLDQSVPSPDKPAAQHPPEHAELRERIRAAYQEVAGGFDRRLLLRDLRPRLADLDRQQVDSALMQMVRDGEASLMQLDYRPDVTDEDRAASLQIGNEPRHIIWISA
ncbi:hypothetical protein [Bradyrhizobium sp. Ai1a-2]|uniref:hypothetical protein n=1 Tax=Bradyrhizobium sp. Ai1a-2 TaxID=196490 RepID=UPI0004854A44|nr:hypothetical protein [Bradyrhizobium sp. Ai1a-2]